MDVILSLGFLCNIFKKAPTVRLFADEYFLDEFTLKNTVEKSTLKSLLANKDNFDFIFPKKVSNLLDPNVQMVDPQIDSNVEYKFYRIKKFNLKKKDKVKVKIEIYNRDSNHTNGFITKSTMVCVPYVLITPTKIMKDITTFHKKWYQKVKFEQQKQKKFKFIKKFYKHRSRLFNCIEHRNYWFKDRQTKNLLYTYFAGGDVTLERTFYKKHNLYIGDPNTIGYVLFGHYKRFKKLSDKYLQYENLRNNH